jgi:hypothetical protein
VDEGVLARADEGSNEIGLGEVLGSIERSSIIVKLESNKLYLFWPTLDYLSRD